MESRILRESNGKAFSLECIHSEQAKYYIALSTLLSQLIYVANEDLISA